MNYVVTSSAWDENFDDVSYILSGYHEFYVPILLAKNASQSTFDISYFKGSLISKSTVRTQSLDLFMSPLVISDCLY